MNDDRRAALEAIAYGDDVDVRPGDRLRALELLDDAQRRRDAHWQPQRKPDTDTELLAQLDRNVAAYVLALTYGNEPAAPELPETPRPSGRRSTARECEAAEAAMPADPPEPPPAEIVPSTPEPPERRDAPAGLEPADLARAWPSSRPRRRHLPISH